jgi:hypothetical protein
VETIPTTPLRTWLFHNGPSGLMTKVSFADDNLGQSRVE